MMREGIHGDNEHDRAESPPPAMPRTPAKQLPDLRRASLDLKKAMDSHGHKLADTATKDEVDRWFQSLDEWATITHGSGWQKQPDVVLIAASALNEYLRDVHRKDCVRNSALRSDWTVFERWVRDHVVRDTTDEAQEATRKLLSGAVKQGPRTVSRYYAMFRRMTDKCPEMDETTRLVMFHEGLDAEIKKRCIRDRDLNTFQTLDALFESAMAEDEALRLQGRKAAQQSKWDPRNFGKHKNKHKGTINVCVPPRIRAGRRAARSECHPGAGSEGSGAEAQALGRIEEPADSSGGVPLRGEQEDLGRAGSGLG